MPKNDGTETLPVVMVVPEQVQTNPKLFQFRHSTASPSGIRDTERFRGKKWDDSVHGEPLLLFEDRNKELFVVDGHHRLDFAKRLNQRFFSGAPKMLKAQVLHESDGITPEQAKIFGAYRNIRQLGIHNPVIGERLVEAAEVIHEAFTHPELRDFLPLLPPTPELLQSAQAATLDDVSFKIATERLPESISIPIAAFTAAQNMPDATKVQVLSVIANALAPLKARDH